MIIINELILLKNKNGGLLMLKNFICKKLGDLKMAKLQTIADVPVLTIPVFFYVAIVLQL